MQKIIVAMGVALLWAAPPSGAQILVDFDEPTYSFAPLDGQDAWQADKNAEIT